MGCVEKHEKVQQPKSPEHSYWRLVGIVKDHNLYITPR